MVEVFAKILSTILLFVICMFFLVVTFDIVVGSVQLAWWLITGEWVHIVGPATTAAF